MAAWPASAAEQQAQQAAQQQAAQLDQQQPRSASTNHTKYLVAVGQLATWYCAGCGRGKTSQLVNPAVAAGRRTSSEVQSRASSETGDVPNRQPIMGLPPRDPRSKSKNMAMKLINKIGNKQPKKQIQAPQYPGRPVSNSCTRAVNDTIWFQQLHSVCYR